MATVLLREIAFSRSGDKGSISNIGVVPLHPRYVDVVREQITPERVLATYSHLAKGPVRRFELQGIGAFNYVIYNALDGGVSRSRAIDAYGKAYGSLILSMQVELSDDLLPSKLLAGRAG
jgi:hypothetical protein